MKISAPCMSWSDWRTKDAPSSIDMMKRVSISRQHCFPKEPVPAVVNMVLPLSIEFEGN